ncbi:MAG: LarC family nickel insertion protein, partial [Actinomycetia bacterium]|nr:LarC family nickel insertion protein [Actinomycetes bacterium]
MNENSAQTALIAHLDCSSGVSGDKFLGALLEVGEQTRQFGVADLQALADALRLDVSVQAQRTTSHGIAATGIKVLGADGVAVDAPGAVMPADAPARDWATIRSLIESAPPEVLPRAPRASALEVFATLAQAEAQVHGAAFDAVHFHEIGGADSIIDICGVCLGLHLLGIRTLYATPPALGSGTVATQHGVLPVPTPATAALLVATGIPTSLSSAAGEL